MTITTFKPSSSTLVALLGSLAALQSGFTGVHSQGLPTGQEFSGIASYYGGDAAGSPWCRSGTACGACGGDYAPNQDAYFAALASSTFDALKTNSWISTVCGQCAHVTYPPTGLTVVVPIVDSCPGCALKSSHSLDLSPQAFADIVGGPAERDRMGLANIRWRIGACGDRRARTAGPGSDGGSVGGGSGGGSQGSGGSSGGGSQGGSQGSGSSSGGGGSSSGGQLTSRTPTRTSTTTTRTRTTTSTTRATTTTSTLPATSTSPTQPPALTDDSLPPLSFGSCQPNLASWSECKPDLSGFWSCDGSDVSPQWRPLETCPSGLKCKSRWVEGLGSQARCE
ncbi:hypothetical protein HDV05_007201 [Chytridiales sp. JEL 0842]|nr:hypothetical protein HDV05_007201 [Chytridiales sp. JEL 0842]